MQAGSPQTQVFYIPQYATVQTELETPLVEKSCQRSGGWGGCKRWNNGCCSKDDGRSFGTFQNFVFGVVFGTCAPLLSIIMTFGMETSKLSRIGSLFGTSNSFFLLATILIAWNARCEMHKVAPIHVIVPAILGLIFLVIALKSFRKFLYFYKTRETKAEEEKVKVISEAGSCCEFAITFFVSLLLPVLGALASIIIRRKYLYGRYGALSGLGFCLIFLGIACSFHGVYPVVLAVGLLMVQTSLVHFRRALVCVEIAQIPLTSA